MSNFFMNTKVETKLCAELSQKEEDGSICARLKGGYRVSAKIETPEPYPADPIPEGAIEGEGVAEGINMGNCGKTTVEWNLNSGTTNAGADKPAVNDPIQWNYIYFDDSNDGVADDTYDDIYAGDFLPLASNQAVPGAPGLDYYFPLNKTDKIKISHEFTPVAGGPTIIAAFGDLAGDNDNLDRDQELSTNFIGLKGGSEEYSYEVKVRNLNNWQAKLKANSNLLTDGDVCEVLYERGDRNTDKEKLKLSACVQNSINSLSVGETQVGVTFNVSNGSTASYELAYSDEEVDLQLTYAGKAGEGEDGPSGDAQSGDVSKRLKGHIKYNLDECSKVGVELLNEKLEVCYYRDIELTA